MDRINGIHYITGQPISIAIKKGVITKVENLLDINPENSNFIGPGLVDLQINGYAGMDLNHFPISIDLLKNFTQALWVQGVTSYLPTVITNSDKSITELLKTIDMACKTYFEISTSIPGIHLEGPFISLEDGPRGAHGKEYVRAPDWNLFQRWQEASGGRIKLITLSPEWPEAYDFIEKCVENDIIVAIGHTSATSDQIHEAILHGASLSTHLGNGAHPVLPRYPNYIWDQLAEDRLTASVIADGFHLPESFLKVVLRMKGEKVFLISDAVALCDMQAGEYETHIGGKVVLTPEGKLYTSTNPNILAGSARMLVSDISHLVMHSLCSLPEAWDMASIRPAKFMNIHNYSRMVEGSIADLVEFHWDGKQIKILKTYKHGEVVFDLEQTNYEKLFKKYRFGKKVKEL